MKVDLHFHSKFSDGSFWPEELVKQANEKGLKMIALTDHDTFEGVPDFVMAANNSNIKGIPAIEIDFKDELLDFESELLGYFPMGEYINTEKYLAEFMENRKKILHLSIEKAKSDYNVPELNIQELLENKIGEKCFPSVLERISVTKPDIYKYLNIKGVQHKYSSYPEFKREFFKDDIFKELSGKPVFSECIKMINLDNGNAVLAHPANQFKRNANEILKNEVDYKNKLNRAKELGLWGIELHSYDSEAEADELNAIFKRFANECGLNLTYGSDFHGGNSTDYKQIGCLDSQFNGFQ